MSFPIYYASFSDVGNTFTANSAVLAGGAVYVPCWSCMGSASVASYNSTYVNNSVVGLTPHGGAVAAYVASVVFSNATFTSNRVTFLSSASLANQIPSTLFGSLSGGAVFVYEPVSVAVLNGSTVRVPAPGGLSRCPQLRMLAICDMTSTVPDPTPTAPPPQLTSNTASIGGAISVSSSFGAGAITVSSSSFANNAASSTGGAVSCVGVYSVMMSGVSFSSNSAASAGAVFLNNVSLTPSLLSLTATSNRRVLAPRLPALCPRGKTLVFTRVCQQAVQSNINVHRMLHHLP